MTILCPNCGEPIQHQVACPLCGRVLTPTELTRRPNCPHEPLTPAQRKERAQKAARARWDKVGTAEDQDGMECDWCGEEFTADSYDLTDGRVFCSEMCRAQGEAGRQM
jgi:formylmethanofuran dehydrogenase subunit E